MSEHFRMVRSPRQRNDLMKDIVRRAWYRRRHVERWERRYQKSYPKMTTNRGAFIGVQIYYETPP